MKKHEVVSQTVNQTKSNCEAKCAIGKHMAMGQKCQARLVVRVEIADAEIDSKEFGRVARLGPSAPSIRLLLGWSLRHATQDLAQKGWPSVARSLSSKAWHPHAETQMSFVVFYN
jgi:hypothetical protein